MKTYLGVLSALSLMLLGCSSTAEKFCAKVAECDELGEGETEEDCVDELEGMLADLRAEDCNNIADRLEDYMECAIQLSCDELDEMDPMSEEEGPCSEELGALMGAMMTAPERCHEVMDCSSTGARGFSVLGAFAALLFLGAHSRRRMMRKQ